MSINSTNLKEKKEKKIYFYDDAEHNKPSQQYLEPTGHIKFIKINSGNLDCENKDSVYINNSSELKINYSKSSLFSRESKDDCYEEDNYGVNLFLGSGLKEEHFTNIKYDVDKKLISCLVFDWDRTISLIEGLPINIGELLYLKLHKKGELLKKTFEEWKTSGFFKNNDKWNKEELAKYFLHDPENPNRIKQMRDALTYAQKKGVPIFILTANIIPQRKLHNIFVDIFDSIGIKINEECVFGGDASRTRYTKNKEEVILQDIIPKIKEQAKLQYEAYSKKTSKQSGKSNRGSNRGSNTESKKSRKSNRGSNTESRQSRQSIEASGRKKSRKTKKTRKNRKSKTSIKKRRKKTKK